MHGRRTSRWVLVALGLGLLGAPGCVAMRRAASSPDLRPCSDGFALTDDGWRLGIRHIRPEHPDPAKLPVVLCHGLGLNATFWTITDDHLPGQLAARGYDVFLVDMRGSGLSHRDGALGTVDARIRETFLREIGGGLWTMDDQALHDVPAVLDYVCRATGRDRVNWIGHSLGGMVMYPFLERGTGAGRVANFVSMGSPAMLARFPRNDLLRANRALRLLMSTVSTGRLARPMKYGRLPGLASIDRFYYTTANVEPRTVSRFYGYTLEDPGAARHAAALNRYLAHGRLVSADGRYDYAANLGSVRTPTLFVAGEADALADVPSTQMTYSAYGAADKALQTFGPQGRPPRRLRPLRPRLEPLRPHRGLPRRDRMARPPPAGPVKRRRGPGPARRKPSMQTCDQVSNRSRRPARSATGTNPASASPASRGATSGRSSS